MFTAIKRMIAGRTQVVDQGSVLSAWAKSQGFEFKRVTGRSPGYVVETTKGWRVEWGQSQRQLYLEGQELRFRGETDMPHDVQLVMLTRALAQLLETDVFSRFTNDMQTQIDQTLPDEMRWLAMHPSVDVSANETVSRQFVILCNAAQVAQIWLDAETLQSIADASKTWWLDTSMAILTISRGRLTLRMSGNHIDPSHLQEMGQWFDMATHKLRDAAMQTAA